MNKLVKEIISTVTDNGAKALKNAMNAIVSLYGIIGALRNMSDEEFIEHNLTLTEGNVTLLNGNDITAHKFKTEYKKLSASTNIDITYWLVTVNSSVVTGIINGQEIFEPELIRYFVRHDRFGGNKILMKLNSEDFMSLQGLIM